jgi:hypothetical protein
LEDQYQHLVELPLVGIGFDADLFDQVVWQVDADLSAYPWP